MIAAGQFWAIVNTLSAYSRGLGGLEPLGRFRAGPIGSAWKENEIFLTARYQF
ncbi:hypothetical protein [Methylibium petroleiphilum]|uniref:hypothetical protein n=1 Tax=Methylibium petroleiphilum TaxID=105560 RepID=UPI00003CD087|nr:hypothetical protein [Methylibium petroleiphilum]